jgi:hypothetical protein
VEDGGEDGIEEGKMVVSMALKRGMVVKMALSSERWWCGWRCPAKDGGADGVEEWTMVV